MVRALPASRAAGVRCRRHPVGGGRIKRQTACVKFERLLEAGSTELPDCRCGAEMNLVTIVGPASDDCLAH